MNSEFSIILHRGIELLVYLPWWRAGLVHGMSTAQVPGSQTSLVETARVISEALCFDHLALPLQCHGSDVVDLRNAKHCNATLAEHGDLLRRESGDALIAPLEQQLDGATIGFGVATADCVPILVRGVDGYVLIHAGWRGLGNGVIRKGLSRILQPSEALVFACAGGQRYEVGAEVLSAIGPQSVFVPSTHRANCFLLDTAATAVRQLRDECPDLQVFGADVCTISDTRFHSFRRDGDGAGRAITFVVPPGK
jgi:copper oxidase (laccase) domain-containing protein